jgi:hypothetical protein
MKKGEQRKCTSTYIGIDIHHMVVWHLIDPFIDARSVTLEITGGAEPFVLDIPKPRRTRDGVKYAFEKGVNYELRIKADGETIALGAV